MIIVKSYKTLTGKELLEAIPNDLSSVKIDGEPTRLMPCTLSFFSERVEISSLEDAMYVRVETLDMPSPILVSV